MRSMRVDYLGVGRCDNGAAELGGGGILAPFSLSGRDNSTIRKLSKITHQMCLSNTLDFTQIPYLNTQTRLKKVNLQVTYIYTLEIIYIYIYLFILIHKHIFVFKKVLDS